MIEVIGRNIGFEVTGETLIYDTEAMQPPRKNPFGYDIKFTPFDESEETAIEQDATGAPRRANKQSLEKVSYTQSRVMPLATIK